jgi:hypothetical protein
MAVSLAEFRKAIEAEASKQNLKVESRPGAPHILEISTAPQPTVLYVKISTIEPGFWGLTKHRIDGLNEENVKWRVVLLKNIDSGYMLTSDEVMQQIDDGKIHLAKDGEYKVPEGFCQSSWKFQGLDAVSGPRCAGFDKVLSAIDKWVKGTLCEDPEEGMATAAPIITGLGSELAGGYNVIPSDVKGPCYPLLVTAIGSEDDVESRILQASRHVENACAGITRTVIFLAAKWDAGAWIKNYDHFADIETHLYLFFAEPIRLT